MIGKPAVTGFAGWRPAPPGCAALAAATRLACVRDALYDDGGFMLDDEGVTIRRYYFPWAGPKRIPYRTIRHVEVRPMNWLTGRGRGWGTAHPGYWFPLDLGRLSKRTLLVFNLGRRVKPCVTPDEPDRVIELLRSRVPVGGNG
jgi:hypothetical protein